MISVIFVQIFSPKINIYEHQILIYVKCNDLRILLFALLMFLTRYLSVQLYPTRYIGFLQNTSFDTASHLGE
jgi:hypothetical protein